ncbi:alpha/beta hydrolase fold domain-containing protein [Parahaliea maris]|uniref:Alpha/beta hydrolase fold domain-containing protein n=1 Tax=Parahaliea maris TaxID=2716870 RepID=A0A5C9A5I6_9GAMM|nr:alpha/beta hydrolase fold domain-containing protein [Parahaliea maris]TXS96163.1 alpha/beta hydrolase fold domain-containing protein [Parahaliea maris]
MAKKRPFLSDSTDRWAMPSPLLAIADEHKYVFRLLDLLDDEAATLAKGSAADVQCIADILYYLTHYPDRFHHPKEDLIFDRMGEADSKTHSVITRLRRGHEEITRLGLALAGQVDDVGKSRSKKQRKSFADELQAYIRGLRDHMHLEEARVFQPAMDLLARSDWEAIDRKIKPVVDPVFGDYPLDAFSELFNRHINRITSVSTGGFYPGHVEKLTSRVESTIFACRQFVKLPDLLYQHRKAAAARQLEILMSMGAARGLSEIYELVQEASANYRAGIRASLDLVRDSFRARELLTPEELEAEAITLRSESDFSNYDIYRFDPKTPARISWQAMLANVIFRGTIKQMMGLMGTGSLDQARRMASIMHKSPPGVTQSEVHFDTFHASLLEPEGEELGDATLLYLPGGGFIFPASSGHTALAADLARRIQGRALLVHYRLAPEHPFPAGLEDALEAYRYLLEERGIPPHRIVCAGDSAGGGLLLSLLQAIRHDGLPLPRAATVISPLADLSFSGKSRRFNRWRDPMLPTDRRMNAFDLYAGDTPPDHPLLSPIYGDLKGFPPLFAQVSSTEILLDDTLRIARRARSAGVEVEVEVWNALPHVWHLWTSIPEATHALERIATYFNEQLSQPDPSTLRGAKAASKRKASRKRASTKRAATSRAQGQVPGTVQP